MKQLLLSRPMEQAIGDVVAAGSDKSALIGFWIVALAGNE